jgi:hypothetical protein
MPPGYSGCIALAEAAEVELDQHWVRCAGDDLERQKFANYQTERCAAVSEGNIETANMINVAEYGLAVAGDRFGADPVPATL